MMSDKISCDPRKAHDRGVVAVWFCILLTVIFGFAAMAVDLGNWYIKRSEVQAATDAAALGGAALLPENDVAAIQQAIMIAGQHGFAADTVDAIVENNSQLKVTIRGEATNIFLPALGFGNTTYISADARAEYEGSVSMGNPDSTLGTEPERIGDAGYISPNLWLGFEGPNYTKVNGDRFGTNPCGGAYTGCTSSVNTEFDQSGYFFNISVTGTTGDDLVVEAFDPIYAGTGTQCLGSGSGSPFPTAAQLSALTALTATAGYTSSGLTIPQGWFDDAATRYQSGDGDWCSGDQASGRTSGTALSSRMTTTFIMRAPDDTPWNPYDNPVINEGTCEPEQFTAYRSEPNSGSGGTTINWDGSIYGILDPVAAPGGIEWDVDYDDDVWTFSETFRRWAPVCRIPAIDLITDTYLLQIRTSAPPGYPEAAYSASYFTTQGLNAMSLRVGFDTGTGTPDPQGKVSLSAAGRLPIFANIQNGDSLFYLAKVLPTSRERNLTVELYDAGDISGTSAAIQVLPPDDPQSPASFSGCQFALDGRLPSEITTNASTCTISNITNAVYNGRAMTVQVPLSGTYDCDVDSANGCWVRLRITYNADAHDFTTWSAYISGDPVRLIE